MQIPSKTTYSLPQSRSFKNSTTISPSLYRFLPIPQSVFLWTDSFQYCSIVFRCTDFFQYYSKLSIARVPSNTVLQQVLRCTFLPILQKVLHCADSFQCCSKSSTVQIPSNTTSPPQIPCNKTSSLPLYRFLQTLESVSPPLKRVLTLPQLAFHCTVYRFLQILQSEFHWTEFLHYYSLPSPAQIHFLGDNQQRRVPAAHPPDHKGIYMRKRDGGKYFRGGDWKVFHLPVGHPSQRREIKPQEIKNFSRNCVFGFCISAVDIHIALKGRFTKRCHFIWDLVTRDE